MDPCSPHSGIVVTGLSLHSICLAGRAVPPVTFKKRRSHAPLYLRHPCWRPAYLGLFVPDPQFALYLSSFFPTRSVRPPSTNSAGEEDLFQYIISIPWRIEKMIMTDSSQNRLRKHPAGFRPQLGGYRHAEHRQRAVPTPAARHCHARRRLRAGRSQRYGGKGAAGRLWQHLWQEGVLG